MISNVSLDSIVNKQRGTHYFTQNSTLLQERLQTANYTEKKKKSPLSSSTYNKYTDVLHIKS